MAVHSSALPSWQTFRQTFDTTLQETLQRHLQALPLAHDSSLYEIASHILLLSQHGKRVRPFVASLFYEIAGGQAEQQPWNAWVGLELIHLFALVHDDVIDRGVLRHTVETMQTFVARRLQEENRNGAHPRISESQAILMGDLVYTWALEELSTTTQSTSRPECLTAVFNLLKEVIMGQALDVDLTTRTPASYELIEQKMLFKTARYTFSRPMQIGALFSGTASPELLEFCEEFGDKLGLAFQLQDDWFDLIASEQRTGKSGYRDLEEAQQTFFTHFITEYGTTGQQERLARLLGHELSKDEKEAAYTLFTEVGAIKHGELLVQKYFQEAERILAQAAFVSDAHRQTLQTLITMLRTRSA